MAKISVPFLGDGKKSPKNLDRITSTTSDFGFCQPIDILDLAPNSTVHYDLSQGVRLAPMPCPTFGAVKYKTYLNYVKYEDIYHAFPSMMSGQSFSSSIQSVGNYIPDQVPDIAPAFLNFFIRCYGRVSIWKFTGATSGYDVNNVISGALASNPVLPADTPDVDTILSYCGTRWDSVCGISGFFDSLFSTSNSDLVSDTYATSDHVSPLKADWIEYIPHNAVDSSAYIVCGRFGSFSRNLSKVIVGLGFEMSDSDVPVSVLPLFAYYKTWFDLFMPARVKTWLDTNAHQFLEYVEQYARPNFSSWVTQSSTGRKYFVNFLTDLAFCYYTDNVDFVSAHIDGQVNAIANPNDQFVFTDPLNQPDTTRNGINQQIGVDIELMNDGVTSGFGQTALDVLKVLSRRLNIRSAIGGRVSDFFKSLIGSDFMEYESSRVGTVTCDCYIEDIYSTAETAQAFLGQFAGKSVGGTRDNKFSFSNNLKGHTGYGYFVVISCAVPGSGSYAQGMDMHLKHVKPEDFYHPDTDSITLLPTAKKFIYSACENSLNSSNNFEGGFGNLPNAAEYKTRLNRINGDMRLQSTRSQFLPYTLDKLLPYTTVSYDNTNVGIAYLNSSVVVNSDRWRYVGKYPWIGMFDRIFTNSGYTNSISILGMTSDTTRFYTDRLDDNFIVHNYIKCTVVSPSLPLSDSWKTECELRDKTMDITPA